MTDTTARRQVGAARRLAAWRSVRCEAIRRGAGPRLCMVTVALPGRLYDAQAHAQARQQVAALVGPWPAWYGLEYGQRVGLHAHILAPVAALAYIHAQAPQAHAARIHAQAGGLRGLAAYLSKPRDARAARSAHARQPDPLAALVAAEDYLQARAEHYEKTGSRRLPVASGLLNVPRSRRQPARPGPGLLLAALVAVLSQQVADHLARADRLAAWLAAGRLARSQARQQVADHLADRQPRPAPAGPSWPYLATRRPYAVGHARSPPIS